MSDYQNDPYHSEPLDAYQEYIARKRMAEAETLGDTRSMSAIKRPPLLGDICLGERDFTRSEMRQRRLLATLKLILLFWNPVGIFESIVQMFPPGRIPTTREEHYRRQLDLQIGHNPVWVTEPPVQTSVAGR